MRYQATSYALRAYEALTGRSILQRYRELLRTQWLGQDELLALQRDKLQRLVEYASLQVPYYRRLFGEIGFHPDDLRRDPACFSRLPFLTKEIMRERTGEFFSEEAAVRRTLRPHSTSGSTGVPFTFWEDHNQRDHMTAGIFRSLSVSGWRLGDPHGYLWGGLNRQTHWPQKLRDQVMNLCFNQFVVGAFDLSAANMEELVRLIREHKPLVLTGYAGALHFFAQHVKERRLDEIRFLAVCATAEVLHPHQRKLMEEVFRCRVFNRYATTEIGVIGHECEAHSCLHLDVENTLVEILKGDAPAAAGEPGEIVVTNLNNYGFPFIRYRLRDIVKSYGGLCVCGRQSPMIECVHGRVVDIFRTVQGEPVWGDLDATLFEVPYIRQSQVVQKALDLVLVRIVREEGFVESHTAEVEMRLKQMLGESLRVQFEFPDSIPVPKTGKFRYAYSELSDSMPPAP